MKTPRSIIATVYAALLAIGAQAQTTNPVANDVAMNVYNGTNFNTRYIDTDKTGRLQFVMYGQDPTTGNFQLRPQRRVFGPSIVCGNAVDSTCDVVASAVSVYAAQIVDGTAVGRAVLTANDAAAARLAIGAGTSSFDGVYSSLTGVPSTFTPSAHTHTVAQLSDATPAGRAVFTAADASAIRSLLNAPSVSEVAAAYYPLSSNPAGYLTTVNGSAVTSALGFTPYNATNPAGYISGITGAQVATALGITPINQAGARTAISLTTTGSGAATYNNGTGVLNVPTPIGGTAFNYGAPTAKTVAASTAYQAADASRAAVITITPACTNTTTVLAASACTLQVRQSSAAGLTCSTGTVVSTWSSTIALGLAITQGNSFPFDVKLPAGGYFAVCPSAGTFTLSAIEQTAG